MESEPNDTPGPSKTDNLPARPYVGALLVGWYVLVALGFAVFLVRSRGAELDTFFSRAADLLR